MKLILLGALLLPTLATAQTTRVQDRFDAAASKAKTGSDPERIICRTAVDTGSLVKRTRRCMTARQWTMRTTGENDVARKLVGDSTGGINTN